MRRPDELTPEEFFCIVMLGIIGTVVALAIAFTYYDGSLRIGLRGLFGQY